MKSFPSSRIPEAGITWGIFLAVAMAWLRGAQPACADGPRPRRPGAAGVGGWSYGGISTNYLIASTTRFKAATSGASSGYAKWL